MQNAGIHSLGLDWRYLAFDVPPENLQAAIDGAAAMRFIGLNLTVPHKLLAVKMVDALDSSARRWGAVNTIRFEGRENGRWLPLSQLPASFSGKVRSHGFNTDADAIIHSLREDLKMEPRNASVVLLGAGGAGRTAALRLAAEGVHELRLINRTATKAAALGKEIRRRFPKTIVHLGYGSGACADLILNSTSAGLKLADPLPLDIRHLPLKNAAAVYDMIYQPAETPLLKAARKAGCRTANGLGMLLHQGAMALEIWSGQPAPMDVMRRALQKAIHG